MFCLAKKCIDFCFDFINKSNSYLKIYCYITVNVGTACSAWQHGSINYIQVATEKQGVHNGSI